MNLAGRLRERRERRNLKNSQVALYLGLSTAHISNIENGNREPSLDLLVRLAEYYRCSVDYLLGLTDDPRPAGQQSVSEAAVDAINLIDSLPPERRAAAVDVLRSILEFAEVGVPLPDSGEMGQNTLPEPVPARQGGGVTKSRFAELGPQQILNGQKKDELLALLKKLVPPDVYEQLRQLVESGELVAGEIPRTDAEIDSLLQSLSHNPIQDPLEFFEDEGLTSNG